VEKLVYGGDGLGRLDGRVVLAPRVLPGERIRAAAERERPSLIQARTLAVLEPSPERVAAACPYFGRCGGCHYQHMPYESQLASKRAILLEEVRRLGKIQPPDDVGAVAAEPWGYRNRVQLHVENGRLGYRELRSRRLCAIEHCPIASPRLNQTIQALAGMLRDPRWPRFLRSLEIFTDENRVQVNVLESDRPVARRFFDWCAERIDGFTPGSLDYQGRFRVGGDAFFQVNRRLAGRLAETALEGAAGNRGLDLYAGVGLFTLPMSERFAEVTAVESGRTAVRDLEFNAARAGRENIRAVQSSTEAYLAAVTEAPEFVLLDPPRTGIGKEVVARLAGLRPPRLAIVACDPSTLARDLGGLTAAGYRLDGLTLVDLFPQTYHVEAVARLSR
jgi:23S rRNA (uracil1939-C5)-methyltransferase